MRAGLAGVVGLVIGAVGALTVAQLLGGKPAPPPPPPPPPPTTLPAAMCDAVVRISLDAITGKPTATPETVCLAKDRELAWDIDPQMEAGEVKIEFKDVPGQPKGPFPDKTGPANPHNNGRGKYVRTKADKTPIRSNAAERLGKWDYNVIYTPDHGTPVSIDPAVCIRN